MATVVEMPRLSDTMIEGTVATWLKAVGDRVLAGDGLAEIETDKAVMTFESFDEGVLLSILVEDGGTVPLGTPIAVLGKADEDIDALLPELRAKVEAALAGESTAAEAGESTAAEAEAPVEAPSPAPAPAKAVPEPTPSVVAPATSVGSAMEAPVDADGLRVKASPLARRIAAQRGIDLRGVPGTGPRGRIIKRDVVDLEPTRRIQRTAVVREDTLVRVTQMRKTIARRLVEAKQSAPHYYLTVTVDARRLVALREELNARPNATWKVGYNDLVMRAVVVALLDHPEVNVAWEGAQIRRFAGVHLGFAVAMDAGLITPVVRDADQLTLEELGASIRTLATRARDMALESHEYTGNSFCVSNLGMFGIEHFTAVINPPAACILAVGALRKEAVVGADGALTVGHRMTLTLSCDHRAVDGAVGAAFLADLQAVLEAPLNLLL